MNITWEVPDTDETLQQIDHFILQIDDHATVLVNNFTATLTIPQISQYTPNGALQLELKAVDECGQKGEELVEYLYYMTSPTSVDRAFTMAHVTPRAHRGTETVSNAAVPLHSDRGFC